MTDFETLYMALGDCDDATEKAYDLKRREKVAEISAYISDFLADPLYAPEIAEALMQSAETGGHVDGDEIYGEVSGAHTAGGNPLAFTI